MNRLGWLESHQIGCYLLALALGTGVGLAVPRASALETIITPVLACLLYATFLAVPFAQLRTALRDLRFTLTVVLLNFVFGPVVVLGLSRFVADRPALLIGVLLVLLAPCIDYVIVFTGQAGGAKDRLLAATPLLMLLQMLLLPVYLWFGAGPEAAGLIQPRPFIEAFCWLILLPMGAAWLTQAAGERPAVLRWRNFSDRAMIPLMLITLFAVSASQITRLTSRLDELAPAVPIFVCHAAVMTGIGWAVGRLARLDVPARRAVVFTGVTRNSLVVLPLALALPETLGLSPAVVVTQTLVELLVLIGLLRLVPRMIPAGS